MSSKILYKNDVAADMNMTKLYSIITDLQSRVKTLEKRLEKPKYMKLDKLFKNLGFSHLYSKFEKQKIDYDTLKNIYDQDAFETLAKIIPTTGDFFKFVKKLKEFFKNDFENVNV